MAGTVQKIAPLDRFLQVTGYEKTDLLDYNLQRGTFVTRNGGKYQLLRGRVRRLLGPEAPKGD